MRLFTALLATFLAASSARADEPVGLRLRRGEMLLYKLENSFKFWPNGRRDGKVESGGDIDRRGSGSGQFHETLWMQVDITDVNGDGDALASITFPRVKTHARMDDTGEEAEWDSQSGRAPAEYGFGPYDALKKSTFTVKIHVNGDVDSLKGPLDYLMARKTKVRTAVGEVTRPEKASALMPMPLPVEFWLDTVFATIPRDGVSKKFKRNLTELLETKREYEAEFDSNRETGGVLCALYHFEAKDSRIEEAKNESSPEDNVVNDFRDGENVKAVLASSKRSVRSWFALEQGVVAKVEGEARDDRFTSGTVAREQKWTAVLEKRQAAK